MEAGREGAKADHRDVTAFAHNQRSQPAILVAMSAADPMVQLLEVHLVAAGGLEVLQEVDQVEHWVDHLLERCSEVAVDRWHPEVRRHHWQCFLLRRRRLQRTSEPETRSFEFGQSAQQRDLYL